MNKISLKNLKALDFLVEDLKWPNNISKFIAENKLKLGKIYSFLSQEIDEDSIQFNQSQSIDLSKSSDLMCDFMKEFLETSDRHIIIVEVPFSKPSDPPYLKDRKEKWMFNGDTVFEIYQDSNDLSNFTFGRFYKAYFGDRSFQHIQGGSISDEEIESFSKSIDSIAISVFDDEGFMIWQNG